MGHRGKSKEKKAKGKSKAKSRKRSASIFGKTKSPRGTNDGLRSESDSAEESISEAGNPFGSDDDASSETQSSISPESGGRRISTSSYRANVPLQRQRLRDQLAQDDYSESPSASDDLGENARRLLQQNSFRQAFPRTGSSGSAGGGGGGGMMRDHSSSLGLRSRSTSENNVGGTSNTRSRVVSSPAGNPFSEDDEAQDSLTLTSNSHKEAFTKKNVYLALKAELDMVRDDHEAIEKKLNETLRYMAKLGEATNAVIRSTTQLRSTIKMHMDMTAEVSRGAVYGSYNYKNSLPDVLVEARPASKVRAEQENKEEGCWDSFRIAFRGFFCSCFDDPDEVEYAMV